MLQWKVSVACLRIWICTIGAVVIVPLEYTWSPSIVLIWMISDKLCLWLFPRVIESESQLEGFIQCGIFCFWKTHFSLFCMRPHFPTQCFTGLGSAGALSPVNWRHQGRWRKQWQFSLTLHDSSNSVAVFLRTLHDLLHGILSDENSCLLTPSYHNCSFKGCSWTFPLPSSPKSLWACCLVFYGETLNI